MVFFKKPGHVHHVLLSNDPLEVLVRQSSVWSKHGRKEIRGARLRDRGIHIRKWIVVTTEHQLVTPQRILIFILIPTTTGVCICCRLHLCSQALFRRTTAKHISKPKLNNFVRFPSSLHSPEPPKMVPPPPPPHFLYYFPEKCFEKISPYSLGLILPPSTTFLPRSSW